MSDYTERLRQFAFSEQVNSLAAFHPEFQADHDPQQSRYALYDLRDPMQRRLVREDEERAALSDRVRWSLLFENSDSPQLNRSEITERARQALPPGRQGVER